MPTSKTKNAAGGGSQRQITPAAQLIIELRHLRITFREAIAVYSARIEGQLSQVIQELQDRQKAEANPAAGRTRKSRLRPRVAQDMDAVLSLVRNLKLKPQKGRRKDLRRVEEAAAEILARINKG